MPEAKYDEKAYRQFYDNLLPLLNGPNVKHMTLSQLKKYALKTATPTKHDSFGWRSMISSRMAHKTVYLGSEKVQLPKSTVTAEQKNLIEAAPDQLHSVLHYLRHLPFVHIRRQMCNNGDFNPICNMYVCVADPKNYRLPYMWGNTLGDVSKRPGPEFTMIHIPEEQQLRMQILTIPEYNLNIALGTDYMGEEKKGCLRQGMYCADKQGMLGLHAGTKIVYVRDVQDNKIKANGLCMFGLTATGKSTWSCHQLGLDYNKGERTEVAQDDIVFLRSDGSAYGTEQGFYVKTDVDKTQQEAMYYALTDKSALYENVMIDHKGELNLLDEVICANGRAIIRKDKLRIKRNNKLVRIDAETINLPPLEVLDSLSFAFITRRNTIMPYAQRLTAEQAVLAYLWGESTHSFATQPAKAGESVRIVGTDDFIIGSRAAKVNRFYNIIMTLVDKYPGKVKFYQYNTGGIGELIEEYMEGSTKKKKLIKKATRVPIDLMSALQRGDLRGTNKYEKGIFGTEEVISAEGSNMAMYELRRYYSQEQIDSFLKDIINGRRKFTDEIILEGLNPEIIKLAEKSYDEAKLPKKKASVFIPEVEKKIEYQPIILPIYAFETKTRPRRPVGF
jgi:phosphoenolpyruvate carboxykinase (ATP)